ncbi:hypothetical protein PENTCL1PPCAC_13532, partial [Pristionchus entomophagus]
SILAIKFMRKTKITLISISWTSHPRDMALLRSTWTDDFEDLYTIGSTIFLNLFAGPNGAFSKSLFPWIAKCEAEGRNYVETNDFRVLCLRLVQTIAVFLEDALDKEKVETFLYKLGQRHIGYLPENTKYEESDNLDRSHRTDCFIPLQRLILLTHIKHNKLQLWDDTVSYIFHFIEEGFYDALKGFDRFPHI